MRLVVNWGGNDVLLSHADSWPVLPILVYIPDSSSSSSFLAVFSMASTAKRVGKKIIGYPEDGVPVISTATYFKEHVRNPKQGVSPKPPSYHRRRRSTWSR